MAIDLQAIRERNAKRKASHGESQQSASDEWWTVGADEDIDALLAEVTRLRCRLWAYISPSSHAHSMSCALTCSDPAHYPEGDPEALDDEMSARQVEMLTRGRWISVTECLPEPGANVLALSDRIEHDPHTMLHMARISTNSTNSASWQIQRIGPFDQLPDWLRVTHWMLLPDAPPIEPTEHEEREWGPLEHDGNSMQIWPSVEAMEAVASSMDRPWPSEEEVDEIRESLPSSSLVTTLPGLGTADVSDVIAYQQFIYSPALRSTELLPDFLTWYMEHRKEKYESALKGAGAANETE